jgi:SAM-dependent methyltransferase
LSSDFYSDHFLEYHKQTFGLDPSPFLFPLLEYLPAGATVLDVGCGSGRDLCWLSQQGYSATGFERSPGLAALARRNSGCHVFEGDFCDYDFTSMLFDAAILISSLVHVRPPQLSGVREAVSKGVKPGGVLLITQKEGEGYREAEDGRIFTLWQADQLKTVFRELEMDVVHFKKAVSPVRSSDIWLSFLVKPGK